MEKFLIAGFLALVAERVIEYLISPAFKRFGIDTFFLLYVGLVVGGLIGWFSEINLFADYIPNLLVGRMLSTVVIGGGSNLIHDLASNKPKPT
ncbi:MAG TPA: hypothetical protein VI729_05190 [Anaerolineales bacterium]|nr:hypothetical protein [Anaerolineales bacterium]